MSHFDKRFFEFDDPKQFVFDHFSSLKIETDSEYKLLEQLNFDHEYFLIFAEHKILSIDEFEKIKAEAKATEIDCTVRTEQFKDGFCKSITDPLDGFYIPSFLELKKESTKRGLPIDKIIQEKYREAKKYEKKGKLEKAKKRYKKAIEYLTLANKEKPKDPNTLNYLGYASRKIGNLEVAEKYYLEGLALDPKHIGINEYLGELYIITKRIDKAKERLEILKNCNCEEFEELKTLIEQQ